MTLRLTTYILIAITMSLASLSFAIEEDELGCIIGDCVNGRGTLVSITDHGETRYAGNFAEGKYNGYGRLNYVEENTFYKGQWVMGKKHGRGTFWDKEKNVYVGEWRNDRRYGQGSQFFKVADWVEDKHSEAWLMEHTENYTGGFQNDVFFGEGTYRWADGTKYVGGWVASKRHGDGYLDYGNGVRSFRKYKFDVVVYD